MERDNLASIYLDCINLLDGGANVSFTKKSKNENKIIIEHSELPFLLDFVDHILDNYTSEQVSIIKIKNRNKIVLYAQR